MRTDLQKKNKEASTDNSNDCTETMKVVRKTLHPLQVAAGDKENLVGAGRMLPVVPEKNSTVSSVSSKASNIASSPKKDKKKTSSKVSEKKTISEDDLTSEDGPSENYWKILAETRRKALEKTLTENQVLHERLQLLTEENNKYKELLDEAQSIIDTLNEVISEMSDEDNSVSEDVRRP